MIKKLMKMKKDAAGMELFFQDELQEILTKEIQAHAAEAKQEILGKAKDIKSFSELKEIEKEGKKLKKMLTELEKFDSEDESE